MRDEKKGQGPNVGGKTDGGETNQDGHDQMNFDEFARNMVRLFDESTKVASTLAERNASNGKSP